tara:strand:- start:1735 stop:2178 length:444 start_codon:yes stop_codon:yes gene_type:complete
MLNKFIKRNKIIILFGSMVFFSIIYLFFDDHHFSGVNYFKEKVKEEVLKKKVEKNIQKETEKEGFSKFDDLEMKIDETVKQAKTEVEEKELTNENMEITIGKQYFKRIYFSVCTGTLLGYGDIYPITYLSKTAVMIQTLITIILIIY